MKKQDILFILVFLGTVLLRSPKVAAVVGLFCLALSIPLFSFWIFFTAERLTWYAAAFILLSAILNLKNTSEVAG